MRIIKPAVLARGATVGLIAPAFVVSRPSLERCVRFVRKLGYNVKVGRHVLARDGFLAGSDGERVADVHAMFEDQNVDAIFCVRGGTGCNRLLPLLDLKIMRKHPKVFLGMSDVSILLNVFFQKAGLVTFHGPNVEWWHDPAAKERLRVVTESVPYARVRPLSRWRSVRRGVAEGRLLGGNLEALDSLAGTRFALDWKDKLFFWEELREDASEISHCLMNYKLRGVFDKIRGMLMGKLYKCPPCDGKSVEEAVHDLTRHDAFPILAGVDFGHYYTNIVLPVGVRVRMDAGKRSVELLESPVKN